MELYADVHLGCASICTRVGGHICFKVMQLESHACTGKIHAGGSDLHAPRLPYVLIIYSLQIVFVCNALFLFLLLYFYLQPPNKPC